VKAITLHQPWASLVAIGAKKIETRSWRTTYRGPIAIHAGIRCNEAEMIGYGCCWTYRAALLPICGKMGAADDRGFAKALPFGAVIAVGVLHACVPTDELTVSHLDSVRRRLEMPNDHWSERLLGNFAPGRWAWMIAAVEQIPPVLAKGRQGLWEWNCPEANAIKLRMAMEAVAS
jgi:hypothetical protein